MGADKTASSSIGRWLVVAVIIAGAVLALITGYNALVSYLRDAPGGY